MNKSKLQYATESLTLIEKLFSSKSENFDFDEISQLAVAIHQIKSFLEENKQIEDIQSSIPNSSQGKRKPYQKFIVVTKDEKHHPMKDWMRNNEKYKSRSNNISHVLSKILIKDGFHKQETATGLVLHYEPK